MTVFWAQFPRRPQKLSPNTHQCPENPISRPREPRIDPCMTLWVWFLKLLIEKSHIRNFKVGRGWTKWDSEWRLGDGRGQGELLRSLSNFPNEHYHSEFLTGSRQRFYSEVTAYISQARLSYSLNTLVDPYRSNELVWVLALSEAQSRCWGWGAQHHHEDTRRPAGDRRTQVIAGVGSRPLGCGADGKEIWVIKGEVKTRTDQELIYQNYKQTNKQPIPKEPQEKYLDERWM